MANITQQNFTTYLSSNVGSRNKTYYAQGGFPSVNAFYGTYDSLVTAHKTLCAAFGDFENLLQISENTPCTEIPRGFTVSVEQDGTIVEYLYKKAMPQAGYVCSDLERKYIQSTDIPTIGVTVPSESGAKLTTLYAAFEEVNEKIKSNLLDREYDTTDPNGLGYIVLKSDKTFAQLVIFTNTIYEIRYEYDLNANSVSIPVGCVLKFEGGKISNGTIVGNATSIEASAVQIFGDNVTIDGTWNNSYVYSEFFPLVSNSLTADNRANIQNLFTLCKSDMMTDLYFSEGVYYLDCVNGNAECGVEVYSNTYVHNSAEFRAMTTDVGRYKMFRIKDANNVVFDGGTFTGDVQTHTGETGEWGHGICMNHAKNVEIKNLTVQKFWGDGLYVSGIHVSTPTLTINYCEDIRIRNVKSIYNRRQGLSVESVIGLLVEDSVFSYTGAIAATAPTAGIDIEPYQAYQVVKDITIRNCDLRYNEGTHSLQVYRGTSPDYLTDDFLIENCKMDKSTQFFGVQNCTVKNCDLYAVQITKQTSLDRANSEFKGTFENCTFKSLRAIIDTDITFYNCTIKNTDSGTTYPLILEQADKAKLYFENCKFSWVSTTNFPYIGDTLDEDKCDISFVSCDFSGAVTGANSITLNCRGDWINNKFDVAASGTAGAYITLKNPNRAITIKDNVFEHVGNQRRLILFANTLDLSSINPLILLSNNRFLNGTTSENEILFCYYATPVKNIESSNNLYIADAGFRIVKPTLTVITSVNDTFKVGNSFQTYKSGVMCTLDGNNALKSGTTADRPSSSSISTGFVYFDTTLGIPLYWDGTNWIDAIYTPASGSTSGRPANPTTGETYFDTTLGKPMFWDGTAWIDAKSDAVVKSGTSADTKPIQPPVGTQYFETDKNKVRIWNGTAWIDPVQQPAGGSDHRPASPLIGTTYFDTNIVPNRMIVWNGTEWVNMDGTSLSSSQNQ